MIGIISVIYIIILSLTLWNIRSMPSLTKYSSDAHPLVSILIPMRNEERNVRQLVENIQKLSYPHLEVIGIDDSSTDHTASLWKELTEHDSRFSLLTGKELPEGWKGKVHACDQLGKEANGEKLLFLDADARVASDTIQQALGVMETHRAKMVTGFPRFPTKPLLAKILVPFQHILVLSHLPIFIANHTVRPSFTAAHGAFLFVDRQAYEAFGGHAAIQNEMVDDVMLARECKRNGFRVMLVNVTDSVECFMYETNREVWEGFQKNIFTGIGKKVIPAIAVTLYYLTLYLLPLALIFYGLSHSQIVYGIPLLLLVLQRLAIALATRERLLYLLYYPFAAPAFAALMYSAIYNDKRNKGYRWKGRLYS